MQQILAAVSRLVRNYRIVYRLRGDGAAIARVFHAPRSFRLG
jgi:hypothetical protein